MSNIERETIILFNEAEPVASVYTYNGALKRKLAGLCNTRPEEARRVKDDGQGGLTFEVPKRWIKVNAGIIYTEEQKKERAERAKANFIKKSSTAVEEKQSLPLR